ncbi:hypothetical protein DSL72_006154 [Monilinia vaccinii-corymbosi]|uniref:Yeast cell wall synthesis Kre9/Knh1-like N-terminal domain-containing protein n=1 Tax=Monilinia vaccinii-corymbosi TaxID=61207 RepID=A0A8A3PHL7_9HELO|nr:hypothetical protein DSL72_006154 [Monilinia vaccinii-corymbosi]
MQFSAIFLAAAAATLAGAVQLTNPSFQVTAGSAFNITWSDARGPVTLTLKNGPSTDLHTVSVIASGLSGESFIWTPPATLDSSLYAIQIDDSTNVPNYSPQFQVSGATAAHSTATASSSSGTTSFTSESSTASSTASITASSHFGNSSSTSSSVFSSPTASRNSTSTAKPSSSASKTSSLTSTGTKTSSTHSGTSTSAPTSAAADIASPLAFVFLAFAAIMTLN